MMKFVRGERLDPADDETIRTCIAAPAENEQRFRASPRAQIFTIDGITVHSRWLPGLEHRFGLRGG